MKRKVLVVLFFLVVFVLPVVWYLFLQLFGENKFELPKIEEWNQQCMVVDGASLVLDPSAFTDFPNQLRRIRMKLQEQELIKEKELNVDTCAIEYDFYLVDEEGWVRGQFHVSREEVDRLMAEIDIYLLNKADESSNKRK